MTPEQAADFAARIFAAIDDPPEWWDLRVHDDHRERVASDLAGLRLAHDCMALGHFGHGPHAARCVDGLRRTGRLYGVTERDPLGADYVCPQCGPDPRGGTAHQEANHLL